MEKVYAGKTVGVDKEGYLTDLSQWNAAIAMEIAKEEGVELTAKHFEVLSYLQDQQRKEVALSIRSIGKSGVVDIKQFYELFPKGPLKIASKMAGIPKPKSCI
ncbi:TusE/DsrC/DsvC family sulfur relay protein [Flavobacterium franklandianum]|uniref:TusE/DsrC/DsvC family sulfur relay protein n=1 Tax=Flavobacterium franklandianum TaxID=2594430 RepID=A0A553CMR3_9FLAO|nr:TusE/DsrC/DsvC family sulfur relay protein [Flavobacterium franklandianum]TRX21695.1 TusE/DsrC/DsvC family sulfur relay protein [Flavobacterium franklandianum]TRX27791.1 TusE/DsrC/DsvC family sulfur relay protein [Flavobacterium franklandianum]